MPGLGASAMQFSHSGNLSHNTPFVLVGAVTVVANCIADALSPDSKNSQ